MPSFGVNLLYVNSPQFTIGPSNFSAIPAGLAQSNQIGLIPGVVTSLFARSPVNPNNYVLTDTIGNLYTYDINGGFRPYTYPFTTTMPTSTQTSDSPAGSKAK